MEPLYNIFEDPHAPLDQFLSALDSPTLNVDPIQDFRPQYGGIPHQPSTPTPLHHFGMSTPYGHSSDSPQMHPNFSTFSFQAAPATPVRQTAPHVDSTLQQGSPISSQFTHTPIQHMTPVPAHSRLNEIANNTTVITPSPPVHVRSHYIQPTIKPGPDVQISPVEGIGHVEGEKTAVGSGGAPVRREEKENQPKKKRVPKGVGSKSGSTNRRGAGGSEDEISKLSPEAQKSAKLRLAKPIREQVKKKLEKEASKAKKDDIGDDDENKLTEADKLQIVAYITDVSRWTDFRVNQKYIFQTVRHAQTPCQHEPNPTP